MKIFFMSLGCDKNLVDSEEMLGALIQRGHCITDDETEAEIIIINTCCFIHDAKEESIQAILEMAEYKTSGSLKALIVTGCLAERYREDITKEIPEVDAVLGTNSYDKIVEVIDQLQVCPKEPYHRFDPLIGIPKLPGKRVITTGGSYEYLKIAEGCDKHCTYCIIPKIRGSYRSVPMEKLLAQARDLAEAGVKELILVAQETTIYGVDLYGQKSLHVLLEKLCRIPGIYWIRVLYCYPEEIYPKLIETMAREEKICHYLDLPIQHASDRILKRMGRRTTRSQLEATIAALREKMPDIVLRTTLITGFPGETEEDHQEVLSFVDQMEFERLGVFTYSAEEDTPAATMENQIPEEVKEERRNEIMELQQEISLAYGESMIGETVTAVVEGKVADESAYVARTYGDTPGIDGYIFINTGELLMTGDFVRVHVTGALEYDLIGEIEDEYTE